MKNPACWDELLHVNLRNMSTGKLKFGLVTEPFILKSRFINVAKTYKEIKNAYSICHEMRHKPITNMLHKPLQRNELIKYSMSLFNQ